MDLGIITASILIFFGTCFGGLLLWKAYDIIKSSINGTVTIKAEELDRLAKAFMQHKKEMEEHVEKLETVIGDKELDNDKNYQKIEAPNNAEGQLSNDLQQKERI